MNIWTYGSVEYVTVAGAAWLASASEFPRSTKALLLTRPWAPITLPCGRVFDVLTLPGLFGRRVLDALWTSGPGYGPVASRLGRTLLFARVGTAERLHSLLSWEEWAPEVPTALCHGTGDAVTVPPVQRLVDAPDFPGRGAGRWIVPPDSRQPWLPGAPALLRACVRASAPTSRSGRSALPGRPFSGRLRSADGLPRCPEQTDF